MTWLTVTVVGFILMTALVIVLARGSTARWEREKRAARAPRHLRTGSATALDRAGDRLHAELARAAATVGHGAVRGRALPRAVIRAVSRRVRALARVPGAGRVHAVARRRPRGAAAEPGRAPLLSGAAVRRRLRRTVASPAPVRSARKLPSRLAARFAHRHDEPATGDRREQADESTTAP